MSEIYELLATHLGPSENPINYPPAAKDSQTLQYLSRLSTLSLADLSVSEPASLLHATQTHQRSLQALSKRSHRAVLAANSHLQPLQTLLPALKDKTKEVTAAFPDLDSAAASFAQKYDRNTDNAVLDRRKKAMLLSRNTDRLHDILDLPSLLSSSVTIAQKPSSGGAPTGTNVASSFTSALDIHSQIKRLHGLYPHSAIVNGLVQEAETEVANLTSVLVATLQSPSLKLAAAMRTIGLLRRVAPDFSRARRSEYVLGTAVNRDISTIDKEHDDGALAAMFLLCRLRTLQDTLDALEPLRELADQEHSAVGQATKSPASFGSQSERYVKRYIEIFREQSFNIVSMYKSIFPNDLTLADHGHIQGDANTKSASLVARTSPMASFVLHLVDMLSDTLNKYLPNITETQTRESLLTQVLYCAASLGRLGGDFSLILASLSAAQGVNGVDEAEWVQVMNKHRVQTARLEVLARGVGTSYRGANESAVSPIVKSPVS